MQLRLVLYYVAKAGLELVIFLLPSLNLYDHRHVPSYVAYENLLLK